MVTWYFFSVFKKWVNVYIFIVLSAADNTKTEKQNEQNINDDGKAKTASEEKNITSNGVGSSEADSSGVDKQSEVDDGKFISDLMCSSG